jgi:hypothetical protein
MRLPTLSLTGVGLVLVGCANLIPSLAPGVHDNAVAYDAAISDINDRVLLANILRARDFVPLNITELSTITGTLSESASLGLSVPFGGNYGSTPRGTVTPSVQMGAAPTFSMAALNTRGFTLNIIQPISPVYIASKWNGGISRELLLLLFVKDIQFADSFAASLEDCAAKPEGNAMSASGKALIACHHKFINNPDSPSEERAFKAVVESMLPSVGIKAMTILEPVGPAFPFLPRAASADDKAQHPLDAYALATHLGDGQYHVGNHDQVHGEGQLYRVYANQVAVCATDPVKTIDGTFYIYPVGADVANAKHAESTKTEAPGVPFAADWEKRLEGFKSQCLAGGHPADRACKAATDLMDRPKTAPGASAFGSYALVMSAIGGGATQVSETQNAGRAGSNAGAGGNAMPAVSASLQENRVGAFLRADDCYADQAVQEPTTETDFRRYTETLGHIEWRSVAEVFQYLGAVLRRDSGITWLVKQEHEIVGSADGVVPETMFALRRADTADGKQAKLKIDYAGENLAIGSGKLNTPSELVNDESLLVLSLLSELVNSAKISSDIPVTQQLQVLP